MVMYNYITSNVNKYNAYLSGVKMSFILNFLILDSIIKKTQKDIYYNLHRCGKDFEMIC